jgi:hypothetical protein
MRFATQREWLKSSWRNCPKRGTNNTLSIEANRKRVERYVPSRPEEAQDDGSQESAPPAGLQPRQREAASSDLLTKAKEDNVSDPVREEPQEGEFCGPRLDSVLRGSPCYSPALRLRTSKSLT